MINPNSSSSLVRVLQVTAVFALTASLRLGGVRSLSSESISRRSRRRPGRKTLATMGLHRSQKKAAAMLNEEKYDYIIAGGGTAGCVLANRLSQDPNKKVLVIEAGEGDPENMLVKIPVAVLKLFKNKMYDWNFASEPASQLNERELYLCRGKSLGGSSLVNVMLYTRGLASDYDRWADMCQDESWRGIEMLDYFKKAEEALAPELKDEWHGTSGPSGVSQVPYQNKLSAAFIDAAQEAGHSRVDDFNDWSKSQSGFGRFHVSQREGRRETAFSAYMLKENVADRPNLHIVQGAMASKVLFNDQKQATGIEIIFTNTNFRTVATLNQDTTTTGEILLTGGAIGSPQLLELSGIGDQARLSALGIDTIAHRPGVGQNLQDHPACLVSRFSTPEAPKSHSTGLRIPGTTATNPVALAKWLFKGTGPLTSPGCDHGGFAHLSSFSATAAAAEASISTQQKQSPPPTNDDTTPDVQFRFLATKTITPDGMSTIADSYKSQRNHPNGFTIQTICARPKSNQGSVHIASNDPLQKPKIETPFFSDSQDVDLMVKALKHARHLMDQPALKQFAGDEEYPGTHIQTDEDLREYAIRTVHTANALIGTCRLGVSTDPDAVVDNELKVIGVNGLRICDSSIMPTLPGGQTASSTLAVAEKAAHILQTSR